MAAKHWRWRHDAIQAVNSAYEAWNSVLAARYFSSAGAGKPVYLSIATTRLTTFFPQSGGIGAYTQPLGARLSAAT